MIIKTKKKKCVIFLKLFLNDLKYTYKKVKMNNDTSNLINCIQLLISLEEIILKPSYGTINITETLLKDNQSLLNWVIKRDDTALTKISFGPFNLQCTPEISLKICNTLM